MSLKYKSVLLGLVVIISLSALIIIKNMNSDVWNLNDYNSQKLDWQNSMGNTNTVSSNAGGTSTSTFTRRLTGISPNTGSGSGSGSTSGSGSGTSGTNTAGSAAGSGTGTSLNYVANAGLKPALSTCKQYYNVGWL
jgi:hypothetical protein